MYKILATFAAFMICLSPITASAADNGVSSNDLIDKAKDFDGKKIVYTGEIIGDILDRGEYTWINVSDGNNAIGVWVKSKDLTGINKVGRYNSKGDTVIITGTYYRACAEHGGDLDIHADKIELIEKGNDVSHKVEPLKGIAAIVVFIGASICIVYVLKKRAIEKHL